MILGLLAAAVELPAIALLFDPGHPSAVYLAPYAHLLAAAHCRMASYLWNDNPTVDHDAVFLTALFVPAFGPCLAWLFPRPRGEGDGEGEGDVLDAHAAFEQFEERSNRMDAGAAWSPAAWEHEADQPAPMSFAEILRHGSIDHKRNAVRMLADFGDAHHHRLLREVLVTEPGELRLCAFIELDRVARRYEHEIADLRAELTADPEDPSTLTALAEAHRALARSGLLDGEMERYHLKQATTYVQRAWTARPQDAVTARVHASILCDVGEFERAAACLAQLDEDARADYDVRVTRARIAYHERYFAAVREEARAIAEEHQDLPEWLQVFHGASAAAPVEEVVR